MNTETLELVHYAPEEMMPYWNMLRTQPWMARHLSQEGEIVIPDEKQISVD